MLKIHIVNHHSSVELKELIPSDVLNILISPLVHYRNQTVSQVWGK